MLSIQPCPLPDSALLGVYAKSGAYTDCYAADISRSVSHQQYVTAFYTTPLFKTERFILKYALSKPSTDEQAAQLAAGKLDKFAAWRVESRCDNQLLMCDFLGHTRSWLMVAPINTASGAGTRLYFGSAVVPSKDPKTGELKQGFSFHALLGFHKLYSQLLLRNACSRLQS